MASQYDAATVTLKTNGELCLSSTGNSSFKTVVQAGNDVYIVVINCALVTVNGEELPLEQINRVMVGGYRLHLQALLGCPAHDKQLRSDSDFERASTVESEAEEHKISGTATRIRKRYQFTPFKIQSTRISKKQMHEILFVDFLMILCACLSILVASIPVITGGYWVSTDLSMTFRFCFSIGITVMVVMTVVLYVILFQQAPGLAKAAGRHQ